MGNMSKWNNNNKIRDKKKKKRKMTDKKQETSEKPEKPGLLSRSPFYDIKQLVSIGMTIACMVLAILAFIDLNNNTSDVEDI